MTADREPKLDSHHRATVEKIFGHPTSHNVQWHDVMSLLGSVGSVQVHEDRILVTLGSETEGFARPKGHDLDEAEILDLQRLLASAGITPQPVPGG